MKILPLAIGYCLLALLLTGCIPILIHAGVESSSREKAAYSAYCDTQAKINSDRQLAGLSTNSVMTRSEWRASLGYHTNTAALKPPRAP